VQYPAVPATAPVEFDNTISLIAGRTDSTKHLHSAGNSAGRLACSGQSSTHFDGIPKFIWQIVLPEGAGNGYTGRKQGIHRERQMQQ
jgi:hypothetical protein